MVTKCCVEKPMWKRLLVDPDFARDEQLQILEEKLDNALDLEDFADAGGIREKLLRLQSGAIVAVLSANMKFYQSLNSKSVVDMAECWMQSPSSTCKHMGGPLVSGYINIINSFGYFFTLTLPILEVRNCRIIMRGSVGYVTCDEVLKDEEGNEIVMAATNMYLKLNGQWYISHHISTIVVD